MQRPKVSIIVPVYGVEKFIEACIDSILKQDYENLEVLIIDDKSPDKSMEIVRHRLSVYEGPIDFRLLENSKNSGQSVTRNRGIEASKGDLIYFLDSDDAIYENTISLLVNSFLQTSADVITGNRDIVEFNTNRPVTTCDVSYREQALITDPEALANCGIHAVVWNKLIRRDFLLRNNLYFDEGIFFEDELWIYKLICCTPTIAVIPESTYLYRIRSHSTMTTFTEKHLFSAIRLADLASEHLEQTKPEMLGYACRTVEKFRIGALLRCIDRVEGLASYFELYARFRRSKIKLRRGGKYQEFSLTERIQQVHYKLPNRIGAVMELIYLKVQAHRMHRKFPNQTSFRKLRLRKDFIKSLP